MKTAVRFRMILLCVCASLLPAHKAASTMRQEAYLKASNTDINDQFGLTMALSGNTLVVGCYQESSASTGVNGNQTDNSAAEAGAAYVFVRDGTNWIQQAYLKASNTETEDFFGEAVSISGDTIVIGASGEDSSATGSNGNQDDNSSPRAGAAYVFVRSGTNWTQQAYLKASNTGLTDQFGDTVAISGNTIVISAPYERSSGTGVNGDQNDDTAILSGAAYVFVRIGTNWTQQAYLKASNTQAYEFFGDTAAISGDHIVIGTYYEESAATGVNGNQLDNSASQAGAAYVFVRSGTNWIQQAYLKASNTEAYDYFGNAVAISKDTIIIGAKGEDSSATDMNGDQDDNSAPESGAAYVFTRYGTNWNQQAYLKASNTGDSDEFGNSVAISDDMIVAGAHWENGSSTGINGSQNNDSLDCGAGYVFVRSGTIWNQQAYLKASNTDIGDTFGESVTISGDTIVAGAPNERSSAVGVNGDESDNSMAFSGAAYVFSGFGSVVTYAAITNFGPVAEGFMIEWTPVADMDSTVTWSSNLVTMPFTNLYPALAYPLNSCTDTTHSAEERGFYKVEMQ